MFFKSDLSTHYPYFHCLQIRADWPIAQSNEQVELVLQSPNHVGNAGNTTFPTIREPVRISLVRHTPSATYLPPPPYQAPPPPPPNSEPPPPPPPSFQPPHLQNSLLGPS